jgi:hypothetical protein
MVGGLWFASSKYAEIILKGNLKPIYRTEVQLQKRSEIGPVMNFVFAKTPLISANQFLQQEKYLVAQLHSLECCVNNLGCGITKGTASWPVKG